MTEADMLFWASAVAAIVGGLGVVTRRNPVYAALWLLTTLMGVAGIFAALGATFLAAVQILVYAGAILVLFLFVIMLLSLREAEFGSEVTARRKGWAALIAALTTAALATPAFFLPKLGPAPNGPADMHGLAEELFRKHLFPFEMVSVLIVAAIVGAVVMAKRRLEEPGTGTRLRRGYGGQAGTEGETA